jgi:hypothetical protein
MRSLTLGLILLSVGCHEKAVDVAEPAKATASAVASAPVSAAQPASAPASAAPKSTASPALKVGQVGPLPASDRVFAVSADGGTRDLLLGTDGDALWAADVTGPAQGRLLWRVTGPGVVQRVAVGDLGRGRKLYVARGVGRGFLSAPLVLRELDPKTGQGTELWRNAGARNECAHLSVADVDGDGANELAFAYYASKYMVTTRHLEADGSSQPGAGVRMASSRAHGDLNGDGKADLAVGRVYGDAKGQPGDLKVDLGKGWTTVPTDNGVRAVLIAQLAGDTQPRLYFADGWVSNYGKEAKAQIKRAQWDGTRWTTTLVAKSANEFTFFALQAADVDADGALELVAQGNKKVTRFLPTAKAPWAAQSLAAIEPVLNTTLLRDGTRWAVAVPHKPHTRMVPVR